MIVSKSGNTTFFQKLSSEKSNIYLFRSKKYAENYKQKNLFKPEEFEVVESTNVDLDKIIYSMKNIKKIRKVIIDENIKV